MRFACDARDTRLPVAVAAVVLALFLPPAAAAQAVQGSFDRTLTVSGPVDLDVSTGSGSIDVRTGPAGSLRVVGRIKASESWSGGGKSAQEKVKYLESHPPIEQTGNVVRIGRIDDPAMRDNVSISYEITAPAQCKLRSRSGSGSQTIGNIDGPVDAATGSGSLTFGDTGGRVDASAGSGSIEAGAIRGELNAHTGSGSIRVRDVRGAITVSTGSGDVEVAQSAAGEVKISAASGSVNLRGIQSPLRVNSASGSVSVQGTPSGEWHVSTASGSITLQLPETAAFDLDAHTSSGRIDSRHPVTVVGAIDRRGMAGKVRGGGPLVQLRTSSGGIRIE
jgi:DUF4097 and DUF4098 domain-containing protein YvlB